MTPFIMPATQKKSLATPAAIPVGSAGVGYDHAHPVGRRSGVGTPHIHFFPLQALEVSKVILV